jgi:hypothetical protein
MHHSALYDCLLRPTRTQRIKNVSPEIRGTLSSLTENILDTIQLAVAGYRRSFYEYIAAAFFLEPHTSGFPVPALC